MKKIYIYIISISLLLLTSFNVFSAFSTTTITPTTITPTTITPTKTTTITPISTKTISASSGLTTTGSNMNVGDYTIKASSGVNINNKIKINLNCEGLGGQGPFPGNQANDPYKDKKCCGGLKFIYPSACYEVDEQTGYKTLLPGCRVICAKVGDFLCDAKYENNLNSSDCDKNGCDTSKNYVCGVKLSKICVLNGGCKTELKYKTYDNECLLKNNTFGYVLYGKGKCEDIEKGAKELTVKIKAKLDFVVIKYISKLDQNYNTKADKIENINIIIGKLEELNNSNPLYVNLTQYIITKLKNHKTQYQNEEDLNIDEILKIFN